MTAVTPANSAVRRFWSLAVAEAISHRQVVDVTPVDGGNYVSAWRIALDGPPLALVGRRLPKASLTSVATVNRVLDLCTSAGVPSPLPVWARGTPGVGVQSQLLTWIEGSTTPPRQVVEVSALADAVMRIGAVDSRELQLREFPRLPSPRWQDRIRRQTVGRPALDRLLALPPPEVEPGLVHGDLCQANILWRDDELVGIIDWDRVSRGPVGVDVAMVWTDLLIRHGLVVAESFLGCVEAEGMHLNGLRYWQLRMVVSSLGGEVDAASAARLAEGFQHLTD